MNDCSAEKFRNCFAEKLALVCLILAAAISFAATAGAVEKETKKPVSVAADCYRRADP